jgi:PAP2 superfamily C-terminal
MRAGGKTDLIDRYLQDTVDVLRRPGAITAAWREAWSEQRFRAEAMLTPIALVAVLGVMAHFLTWVEHRPGVLLSDPVLALVPARDVTWLTFGLVHLGVLSTVAMLLSYPRRLMAGAQAYAVMVLFRMAVMSVTPLEAPPGMIPLRDPLIQVFGTGEVLTRDLFFSGHTATLALLTLLAPGRVSRRVFAVCTALVAVCVLWQHVHYTVDVLVAPFFAFASRELVFALHPGIRRSRAG